MFSAVSCYLAAIALPGTMAFPYPYPNITTPHNGTYCDGSIPPPGGAFMCPETNSTAPNASKPIVDYHCQEIYASDLTIVNSRYPTYNESHLHNAQDFFMLRRQLANDGEIATRVQFQGLPTYSTNITCRLEFILPQPDLQRIQGFNPSFNVYQVERDTDTIATWETYVGNNHNVTDLFGTVNGEAVALERTRAAGGVTAINSTRCKETLTFQMGMKYNSRNGMPNYWEFAQVAPPARPVQGFRVVYGC